MAQLSPIIQHGMLTDLRDGSAVQIVVDSSDWYAWLQTASTFTFRGEEGLFTAHKERAGNRRGRAYWRAYCTRQGKLHRAYLGQSEELTLERLKSVAGALASKGAGEGSLDVPDLGAGTGSSADAPSRVRSHRRRATEAQGTHEAARSTPWLASFPVPLTALIGREQEVRAICDLLARPEVRLLTITGTGGVGKTRLALEVTSEVRADFPNGVCFVPLAPVSDPALVIPTIAQTFTLRETADQPPLEHLKSFLREKHLLLLLDNFEQVLEAAPLLTKLLQACPSLKMVVTSRFVLHVSGEHEFSVPPLALPELTHLPEIEALPQYAAVALFLQRSRASKPEFQLTDTNARAVAEICVRLDGLPLAIELAAVRIKLLPPQALLARLGQRLQLLTDGAQDVPARQQTLRNTIVWSYQLLDAVEQRLFRCLSVFVGGCTLQATEVVCHAGNASDGRVGSLLDAVASLIDKSLLHQTEQEGEEPRLVMLETIREYGLEMLAVTGEREATQAAHAHIFLALAEQSELGLHGPNQTAWLERLEREHDNLRAALEWAMEEVTEEQARERWEIALRLSAALEAFWWMRGYLSEGRTELSRALVQSEGKSISLRAKVLRAAANLAIWQGDDAEAEVLAQQSLALYRELADRRGIAISLFLLGDVAWRRGKIANAIRLFEERLMLMQQVGEPWEVAEALFYLADTVSMHGNYARGQSLFEEALVLFRKAGNELWVGATLVQSALWLWFTLGSEATIRQRLQQGQMLINKVGSRDWSAECSWLAALLALSEGEPARSFQLVQESLAIYREVGSRWFISLTLHILGRVEAQRHDLRAASSHYQESLALSRELGEQFITPFNLEGLAGVAAAQGEFRRAARLWGAAEVLRETMAIPLPPVDRPRYEQALAIAQAQLGEQGFAAAWADGRTMTPEQALAGQEPMTMTTAPAGPSSVPHASGAPTYPAGLTAREAEVLRLVAQGLSDTQVAEQLVISPRTVNWHLTAIYSKLGVSSRSAATRYAIEQRLL